MTITIHVHRRGAALLPVSEADQAALADLPPGRAVRIEVHIDVPRKLPRLYYALLKKLVEGGCRWPTVKQADRDLLVELGYRDAVLISSDGETHTVRYTPASKAEWEAPEWRAYFAQVYEHVLREVLPGQSSPRLRAEIEKFAGVSLKEAMEEADAPEENKAWASSS